MRKMLHNCLGILGFCLLTLVSGCQTWNPDSGLTLPSPDYLNHPPNFYPKSPEFPLPKETDTLNKAIAAQAAGAGAMAIK
jgi:hypothetical protein